MKHRFLVMALAVLWGCASPTAHLDQRFGPIDIRDWKIVGCVKGRAATQKDINQGNAVFLAYGPVEKPLDLDLPRCAIWHNRAVKRDIPVIVIQAEEFSGGMQLAGVRFLHGDKTACPLKDLILLPGPDERFEEKEPKAAQSTTPFVTPPAGQEARQP